MSIAPVCDSIRIPAGQILISKMPQPVVWRALMPAYDLAETRDLGVTLVETGLTGAAETLVVMKYVNIAHIAALKPTPEPKPARVFFL